MDRLKKSRRAALIAAGLAIATLGTLWPVCQNQFIRYDDLQYIVENPHVITGLSWANLRWAFGNAYAANWHPLTWVSHMLDVQFFGLRPGWHHFTSLILHTGNCLLLFLLLKRLTGAEWRSAAVAALFALHPLHVESVAWAAERKDVLSTFFFMLTLLAYTGYVQRRREPGRAAAGSRPRLAASHYYLLAVTLFALGLMSKPMLVTLPFLLLLLDFWPLGRFTAATSFRKAILPLGLEKLPFFVLSLGSCVITFLAQDQSHAIAEGFPLGVRVMNAAASYSKYLIKTLWPAQLTIIYPHPALSGEPLLWPALAGGAALVALTAGALALLRKQPWLAVGWFWYLGTLVPVIGLVQAGNQAMADRYTYIPLIGIFVSVVWTLGAMAARFRAPPEAMAGACAAVCIACSIAAHQQVKYWRTNFTLFSRALEVTQKNALARINVGIELAEQGKFDLAELQFRGALEADSRCADAYYYLGVTCEVTGRVQDAPPMYEKALQLFPNHDLAMSRLGGALRALGRDEEALYYLRESARLNPVSFYARSAFGRALADRGDLDQAASELAAAAALRPGEPQVLSRFAEVEFKRGRFENAEAIFGELVRNTPTNIEARLNLAGTLWKRGQADKAFAQYSEAARLDPRNANVHYNLGIALTHQGGHADATLKFSEAVRLKPDLLDAWTELGRALAAQGSFDQARVAFEKATRLCPTNANLQLNLANSQMLCGRTNDAARAFSRAVEIQPGLPDKFLREGETLARQGQWTAALARFKTALWLRPDDPEARSGVAWLLATHPQADVRNGPEALRLALSVLARGSDQPARFWAALDAAYAETGDFGKAIEAAEKAHTVAMKENQPGLAEAAAARLSLYRQQKPFHQEISPRQ